MNLEARAVAAEKLIALLKQQIAEAKTCSSAAPIFDGQSKTELDSVRQENAQLKLDIEAWKRKLTDAQANNGKQVFYAKKSSSIESGQDMGSVGVAMPSSNPPNVQPAKPEKSNKEKVKKEKKEKPAAPSKESVAEAPVDIGRLDLRVGHIRTAKKHPDADSLYVEEVDVGEEKPRTVISGLVKFIPEPEMQNRMAVILCNLKPSKMRGIMSEAMVMCASTADNVEILAPPVGSKPGDPVLVEGFTRNPDAQLNPKKKIFEACAPDLTVNSNKEACFKGVRWTVNGQSVMSQTLTNVKVK